jgi:hypothetical protein
LAVTGGLALAYDISPDGREVVAAVNAEGKRHLFIAPIDRSTPAREIPNAAGDQPIFARDGSIYFRSGDGAEAFVSNIQRDGSGMRRVIERPVARLYGMSPDNQWALIRLVSASGSNSIAWPLGAGEPVAMSPTGSVGVNLKWSRDGRLVFISMPTSMFWEHGGRTYVVPLRAGQVLPPVPPGGFSSAAELAAIPGATRIAAFDVAPGPDAGVYAFAREISQRNLYRIPIR